MRLELLPDELENDDILPMLDAGLIQLAVIEQPLFEFWKQIFPRITGHPELAVRRSGSIAWAIGKQSPRLRAALDAFITGEYRQGSTARNVILTRYLSSTRWARPVRGDAELARYQKTVELFRRYAQKYEFEPLLVLAQGFQESRLDQSLVSPSGAIGLMQVMPEIGRLMKVGDIRTPEANVHAGIGYLRKLITDHFDEPQISEQDRLLFAFASYNAGPTRISRLREEAAKLGYSRDHWFGNVELVVADRVGREPVDYVGNILKYYVAYRRVSEEVAEREAAREKVLTPEP
jgi:membrane-bound lytic murein transglycosylase MltF